MVTISQQEIDQENLLVFSQPPEPIRDSVADQIKERIAEELPPSLLPLREILFRAVDRAEPDRIAAADHERSDEWLERVAEILMLFAGSENARLLAHCFLLLIDRSPYSEVQIAQMLGVTKAAVSKVKVALQDAYGFHCRTGRSDEARHKFSVLTKRRHRNNSETKQSTWNLSQVFTVRLSKS